jgi:osmoprotectant transport system ATP-binding protein
MIIAQNLTKSFTGVSALDNFSYTFGAGSSTVLIGPSGCGKSTLLRVVVGLVTPDTGEVQISRTRLTPQSIATLRARIGYVIQNGGLFPHLTAYDNVALLARQEEWPTQQVNSRIEFLSDLVRLSANQLSLFPSQLSGGQRQRVSIIRALMLDPEILLLDEPLGALDSIVRSELQQDLRDIFGQLKKTVLMVTHDLAEATFFTDDLILMNEGSIVATGSLKSMFSSESQFVRQFVEAQHSSAKTFITSLQ